MRPFRASAFVLAAIALPSVAARAAEMRDPRPLAAAIRSGDLVLPAAWAGVWQYVDSTFTCQQEFLGDETGVDTLCAGIPIEESLLCSGMVTDTNIDVTCSESVELEGCTVTATSEIHATRSGDVIVHSSRWEEVSEPKGCSPFPDHCEVVRGRLTRAAPPPASCNTPVHPSSWGRVKILYR
jgi:hypothetical protein